ncbi:hypothetical protein GOBAR_AA38753 [Gossypium barbadense]|uniref:Uncharacterized protein n=1 Tax=Gossypium barbadense TaxID=3634 RepID=A0A2P5VSZ5_GOSBA|nr:hypothetical protein GOBAR_AA38753 [Gossypium barbadense]
MSHGGGDIERTGVVQGTTHTHLMPRRWWPPSRRLGSRWYSDDPFGRWSSELSQRCSLKHPHIAARTCWSLGRTTMQPRTSVVREPRAASATWCLGYAGASDTIGNLGPWSYGSLGHHRQPRPLVVRELRAPSVT